MPAARASLQPEFRLFYDTLTDYGEWVLIEPWGYVFRPRVNFDKWRPFGEGTWVPTDLYGWVWLSSEPYGWATYHYGDWAYDSYQGWVWRPGIDWSPAQVVWQTADNYVGWAPQMADPSQDVPGGAFNYVPAKDLASTDLAARIVRRKDLDAIQIERAQPVENLDVKEGIRFNRGPNINWVERFSGLLRKAKVEDVVPSSPMSGNDVPTTTDPAPERLGAETRRAALRAASEVRADAKDGETARVPVVRPIGAPGRVAKRWGQVTKAEDQGKPVSKAPADTVAKD